MAMVPVAFVGSGLTPGDAISVEPIGIPVGETDEPDVIPSGVVAPTAGTGSSIVLICAVAAPLKKSAGSTAATNVSLILLLPIAPTRPASMAINSTTGLLDAERLDIGQSLSGGPMKLQKIR